MSAPHETDEWRPFTITQTNATTGEETPVTTGVTYSIVPAWERPGTWTNAEIRDGQTGYRVSGLDAGTYQLYAKVDAPPDTPIINCGTFTLN